ncbi:RNA ligase family protein [Flavobacterium sp. KACC 22758]|uniref:RNA ligase family protein n=1 Tax=Flavobacterium sp. KACC 22758 TaxID=3025667 RepID=UPI002365FE7B|nr:RNA ligase family protein [Flavobacterium sp. KACC 22758]WDF60771.1 RNA ligase family protein [Flavobacterium sp. KACC 22758]
MSTFSEYEKMPENFNQYEQNEKLVKDMNKLKWVVTEKVHGANFSFVYQNKNLQFAKRKDLLKWNDDFFGFQSVISKIETQIISFFEQLSFDFKADKYIVYGELFGGHYPHQDVVPEPNVQAIQTGVYYTPEISFCAFDIAFVKEGKKEYLDYDLTVSYFEKFSVFHAKILFSGKLNEALEFNKRISSTIPALLNLPLIEDNLIEGIVVKPLKHNGLIQNDERPVIKLKNAEFKEQKFHQAQNWSYIPEVSSHSEELTFLIEDLRTYITENRLNSVLSKIGAIDFKNIQRMENIYNEFVEDVLLDFNIQNDQILNDILAEQREWIVNRIKPEIRLLVENHNLTK